MLATGDLACAQWFKQYSIGHFFGTPFIYVFMLHVCRFWKVEGWQLGEDKAPHTGHMSTSKNYCRFSIHLIKSILGPIFLTAGQGYTFSLIPISINAFC